MALFFVSVDALTPTVRKWGIESIRRRVRPRSSQHAPTLLIPGAASSSTRLIASHATASSMWFSVNAPTSGTATTLLRRSHQRNFGGTSAFFE